MKEKLIALNQNLDQAFDGNPWYGVPLLKKLNSIDYKIANKTPHPSANSIARLVQHMINWKIFVIEKLKGNEKFDIKLNSQEDWTEINIQSSEDWISLLEKLKEKHSYVTTLLLKKDDPFLSKQVPGKNYDYNYLIEGIIQHDIYHLGQICLIEKLLH